MMEQSEIKNNRPSAYAEVGLVGAGPIGIEMAAALKRAGISTLHFDAHQIGHTISWWPRNTHFFSTTERVEIAGIPLQNTSQQRATGEEYLAYLRAVVEQLDLQIHTYEPVVDIQRVPGGFRLTTRSQSEESVYHCCKLILAIGDMHAPKKLGIPGEDLPHVTHYFDNPHQYFRKRLLVVGGRNSAVEAALRCWRAGSWVSLSYRRAEFNPKLVKHWILPDLQTQIELGTIRYYPETVPVAITPTTVCLASTSPEKQGGQTYDVPADFVFLATGYRQDPGLFRLAGVHLLGEQAAPQYDPETMETNVPGVFVAGTAAAGTQSRYRLFIENSHVHVAKIMRALTGDWPEQLGTVPSRQYEPPFEDFQAN